MGRKGTSSWKIWNVIASVATFFVAKWSVGGATTTDNVKVPCSNPQTASQLMLVSTLDGTVSALDLTKKGSLVWSISTGSQPLLSSSISKLGILRNGERTRLIPSLDGGLYQYNGESIEAVPFTAETLLSSSFKLSEHTVVVGGKELCSYGLERNTGQVRYMCTLQGCKTMGKQEVAEEEDILMITRNTHTVRAVDSRTGTERWNFSVGQHEVHLIEAVKKAIHNDSVDEDEDGISIVTSPLTGEEETGGENEDVFDGVLKVIVPSGVIMAVSKTDPNTVLWKQKFPFPIANAWTIKKGFLEGVNLFNEQTVPALTDSEHDDIEPQVQPLLYVGVHQDQLYVQPSVRMKEMVYEATNLPLPGDDHTGVIVRLPRVTWKPYLATAFSRTPALRVGHSGREVPLLENGQPVEAPSDSNAIAIWNDMYPYDSGCYLYPDFTPVVGLSGADESQNSSRPQEEMETISVTLWNWWKEVVAITVVTAVVVHMLTARYSQSTLTHQVSVSEKQSEEKLSESKSDGDLRENSSGSGEKSSEFTSRYYTDFDHMRCLGKGGFGIVFEAMNKMDECAYAVKRISLNNSATAKEKVMREVKALAKLDHAGIVRYYQAWLESPPVGWQEDKDKALEDSECLTATPCNTGTDLHSDIRTPPYINPFRPENLSHRVDIASDISTTCDSESGGFMLREDQSDQEESGSFSLDTGTPCRPSYQNNDDSFEVVFTENSESGAGDAQHLFNLQKENDSYSIVFEDSGCGDGQCKTDNGLKVLKDNLQGDSTFLNNKFSGDKFSNRFSTDLKISKSSVKRHYGLPKLYLFIQMQLCQRETLKDWLVANTLNRDRHTLLDVFDQIVTAVQYVHDCGLMHRDLKPSNIFFTTDGVVKIGDFGLVTALSEQTDTQAIISNNTETEENHTAQVGTQLYMSPEQVNGKPYGQKVDIFSLGVILFELLYPFATQMERIRTLQDVKKHRPPMRFKREMPSEHDFVIWLLANDPEKRPTTKEIIDSSLLEDFSARHHVPKRMRTRNISSEST